MLQNIFKNILSLLVSNIFYQIVNFFSLIYIAKIIGPEGYGEVSIALAYFTYFAIISNFGLNLLGTKEIAKHKNIRTRLFSHIFTIKLFLTVIAITLMCLLGLLYNSNTMYLIMLYSVSIFSFGIYIDWFFQGIEKMKYIGISKSIAAIVYFLMLIVFVKSIENIYFVPFSFFIGQLIASIYLFVTLRKKILRKIKVKFSLWKSKILFLHAYKLGISIFLIQIIYNIDIIMLDFFTTKEEVGLYSAAYKLIMPFIMIGAVYFDVVFPIMARFFKESKEKLETVVNISAKIMFPLSFLFGVLITLAAKDIILIFYGEEYIQSVKFFEITIWIAVVIYWNMVYARVMWVAKKEKEYIYIIGFQAVINIGMNYLLIPIYGGIGAAISTIISELVGLYFYFRVTNTILRVRFLENFLKPFLIGVVIFTLGLIFDYNFIIESIILLCIFLVSLFISNYLKKSHVLYLKKLVSRGK